MKVYIDLLATIIIIYVSIINLNSVKFKLKENILMGSLMLISSFILVNITKFGTAIPIIIIPMIFLFKNSGNKMLSVTIPIVSVILPIIIDLLVGNTSIWLFGLDIEIIKNNSVIHWSAMAFEFILVFIISRFLGVAINKKIRGLIIDIKGKSGFLIVLSIILTFVIIYTNVVVQTQYGISNEIVAINGVLFLAYFILLMVIMSVLIKSVTKELEYKNKQIQFENLQRYTSNLELLYTEMRGFKHDYINILSTMADYIKNKDIDGLEKHFNENIFPLSNEMKVRDSKFNLLKNIKIPEIKGIISAKLIRAQELNVDVDIDIMEPIEEINMDIIDISRCLGILIDNAIEAAEKTDKPYVMVAIVNREKSIIIGVTNSCNKDMPSINKMFQKGFSTKGENRGIGLSNLNEILNKYKETAYLETSIKDNKFTQLLEIRR